MMHSQVGGLRNDDKLKDTPKFQCTRECMPSTSNQNSVKSLVLTVQVSDPASSRHVNVPLSSEKLANTAVETPEWLKVVFVWLAAAASLFTIVHCNLELFYNMDLNKLSEMKHFYTYIGSITISGMLSLLFFGLVLFWIRQFNNESLDQDMIQETKPDFLIMGAAACVTTLEMLPKLIAAYCSWDHHWFIRVWLILCPIILQAALLSQYFALKRVIALTERHIQKTKRFFSWVVLASITINVANFVTTFLHSSMIKNVMAEEKYDYDTTVLLVLFAIQFLMPADYLFSFTMAATWSNLLIRYYQSGAFEYRQPSEEIDQIMQSSESNVPRKNQESHDSKTKKT